MDDRDGLVEAVGWVMQALRFEHLIAGLQPADGAADSGEGVTEVRRPA